MTVRHEIVESPSETGARSPGDWLRRLWRCLSRFGTGTGARKKGASPQQDVNRPSGEPARLGAVKHAATCVAAANPRLQ